MRLFSGLNIRHWCIVFSTCLGVVYLSLFQSVPALAASSQNLNILVLSIWNQNIPWQKDVERGMKAEFAQSSVKAELFLFVAFY